MKWSRRALPGLLAAAVIGATLAACGPRPEQPVPDGQAFLPDVQPVSCETFELQPTTFTVDAAGGKFAIGPDHSVEFAPGAVSSSSSYVVRKGPRASPPQYWAEIEIAPQDGAPRVFSADVFLNLSYESCPGLLDYQGDLVLVKTSSPRKGMGGRDDRDRRALRALLPHLTMFSIAR